MCLVMLAEAIGAETFATDALSGKTISMSFGDAIALGLITTRIMAMFLIAPIFRARTFPMRFRVLMAIAVAILVAPSAMHGQANGYHGSLEPINVAMLFLGEAAIGMVFGVSLMLLFNAADLAGRQIAGLCGSQFPGLPDEMSDSGGSPVAKLYGAMCLLVFLLIGGHRRAMTGLLDSFQQAKVGSDHLAADFLPLITGMLTHSFEFAVRLGAPIILACLLAMLVLGLASRGLPNFNLMQSTFTVNTLLSLLLLIGCAGSLHALMESQHEVIHERITDWLDDQNQPQAISRLAPDFP